ncbi:MAG: hypothetical protein ABIP48_09485, partial [Planctomycetota bacterium]
VINALQEKHGIYTQATRSNPLVLRIQPPLTITADEVTQFLAAIEDCALEIEFCLNLIDEALTKSGTGQHQSQPNNNTLNNPTSHPAN